jgi:hypothetical protein
VSIPFFDFFKKNFCKLLKLYIIRLQEAPEAPETAFKTVLFYIDRNISLKLLRSS